ncbi:MAG: TraR/DksA C4-type zinc finger protein [Kiritimatiellae bacterium]|nr:TraR/DksA C4-type zinc finger protein [Kiritimatiellia bacterium]
MPVQKKPITKKSSSAKKSVSAAKVSAAPEKLIAPKPDAKTSAIKKPVAPKPVAKKAAVKKPVATKPGAKTSAVKKPVATKPGAKTSAVKKPGTKKAAVKKAAVKKPSTKKAAVKKTTAKKSSAKKKTGSSKKTTSELLKAIKALDVETQAGLELNQKHLDADPGAQPSAKAKGKAKKSAQLPIVPPMQKAVEIVAPSNSVMKKNRKASFGKKDLNAFRVELLGIREHFMQQTRTMRHDALQREDGVNCEEDGTDAFMRLQVLNQMSNQHRTIAEIDEALNDIETGVYGICEMCECLISKLRLKARPFARFCIKCKSEMERADRFNKPR